MFILYSVRFISDDKITKILSIKIIDTIITNKKQSLVRIIDNIIVNKKQSQNKWNTFSEI